MKITFGWTCSSTQNLLPISAFVQGFYNFSRLANLLGVYYC